jgi:nucleotide-binding universal stress UspA family protein
MAARSRPSIVPAMTARSQRIIVGYDGSDTARRALEQAADLAGYGSSLTVVSVAQARSTNGDGAEGLLDEAREILARRHEVGRYVARTGDAAEELIETARQHAADLLVVGRRNEGLPGNGTLGSVSDRVVRQAPCDVLVVT